MATTLGGQSFEVLRDSDGGFPMWEPAEQRIARFPIVGLNEEIVQMAGWGDETLSVRVRVANEAVVTALKALRGTTLRTLAGYPSPEGDATYTNVYVLQVRKPRWIGVPRTLSGAGTGVVELELGRASA